MVIVGALGALWAGGCDDDGGVSEAHSLCRGADRACIGIQRDDLGGAWPFSVRDGALSCTRGGAITLAVQEEKLGLDATGAEAFGLNKAARDRGYSPPYPIWKWDTQSRAADLPKSLKPVLRRGRALG